MDDDLYERAGEELSEAMQAMQAVHAEMAVPDLGAREWTVDMYRRWNRMTRSEADNEVARAIEAGRVRAVGKRRLPDGGRRAMAYVKVEEE